MNMIILPAKLNLRTKNVLDAALTWHSIKNPHPDGLADHAIIQYF